MVLSTTTYQGEKHCDIVHAPSESQIQTDAPKDNQGRGQSFSPTDLVGAALGSCVLTTVAIHCEKDGLNLKGAKAEVSKEMVADPRRIAKLSVKLYLPKGISLELRPKLQQAALGCPVMKSLHPDIQSPIEFIYPD
jgi:putative redox protein